MFHDQIMVNIGIAKLYEMITDRFSSVSFDSKFHFIEFVSYFTENIRYLADKVVDHVSWSTHGQFLMLGIIEAQSVTLPIPKIIQRNAVYKKNSVVHAVLSLTFRSRMEVLRRHKPCQETVMAKCRFIKMMTCGIKQSRFIGFKFQSAPYFIFTLALVWIHIIPNEIAL